MNTYTADNIQVRHDLDFSFEKFERLCAQYKTFTREGIKNLLEVALTVDEDWEKVERRFLCGDKSVDVSSEYRIAYAETVDKQHGTGRTLK